MAGDRDPLGAGLILGESFSLLFSRFHILFLCGIVMTATVEALLFLARTPAAVQLTAMSSILFEFVPFVLWMSGIFLFAGLAIPVARTFKYGQPTPLPTVLATLARRFLPLVLTALACAMAVSTPLMVTVHVFEDSDAFWPILLPVVLMIFLFGLLAAAAPSIVAEDTAMTGLSRSFSLTSGYRWRCGLVITVLIIVGAFFFIVVWSLARNFWLNLLLPDGPTGAFLMSGGLTAMRTFGLGLFCAVPGVGCALICLRLIQIRDGARSENVESTFA